MTNTFENNKIQLVFSKKKEKNDAYTHYYVSLCSKEYETCRHGEQDIYQRLCTSDDPKDAISFDIEVIK